MEFADQSFSIALPIGISFYTFQIMSYIIDVYRKQVPAQKSLIDLSLYISFFPQLTAGPIIRYNDIAQQLQSRKSTLEGAVVGTKRFIIGLGKKVIIANNVGFIADMVFSSEIGSVPQVAAWIGIIAYALQIYFDFSAYSDMAIGLARIFGFKFLENFNYPYSATSIQDFWRRWHISLSNWFRDYLYIPLGGNRRGKYRAEINRSIVFLLCGLWHGASWTFVVWGAYYGLILTLERLFLSNLLERLWKPLRHLYTWLVFLVGWVFFRADTLADAVLYLRKMFTFDGISIFYYYNLLKYLDYEIAVVFVAAILFSFPIAKATSKLVRKGKLSVMAEIVERLSLIAVLGISILYVVNSTYNPFIYFRF